MTERKWYRLLFNISLPIARLLYPSRVIGRENLPEGPAIICPLHSNAADPVLVSHAMGRDVYCRHMAKSEFRGSGFVNWVIRKVGGIYVNRGESDIDSYRSCIKALKAGDKLMIFPEGTRVHGDNRVEPKSGVVRMAAKARVPLVPVYIPRDKKLFHRIDIVFGKPYTVENAAHGDYERLSEELMDRIWALKGSEP